MPQKVKKQILVTAGLPYANGPIHLGHLVEYLQADIWSRYQRLKGHECLYLCGDDAHGTPIMLKAQQQNITPEKLIAKYYERHIEDFTDFEIEFTNFYTTHSPENKSFVYLIYKKLKEKNLIEEKNIKQLYCDYDKIYLPDRFIKGGCPFCKAENQYGDSCEVCGAFYSTLDIKEPFCVLCNRRPKVKTSKHLFFKLSQFKDFLKDYVPKHTQEEVANKHKEWLKDDLKDWDISRDSPYFGFEIPEEKDKFFYVWLDAPIGYMASLKNWCEKNKKNFEDFWSEKSEIYHFIGPDIAYFHLLFWPSVLKASDLKTPDYVFVHGMLTVNKEKMSKSRNNFITARAFLNHINPLFLRYYYASKLNGTCENLDFNSQDFILKINSEFIGKITNLASRSAKMLNKKLDSLLSDKLSLEGEKLFKACQLSIDTLATCYEKREFSKVIRKLRVLAEEANRHFDHTSPWITIKEDPERARQNITDILNVFYFLVLSLKPILPSYAKKVEALFNEKDSHWDDLSKPHLSCKINNFEHLVKPIDKKQLELVFKESHSTL